MWEESAETIETDTGFTGKILRIGVRKKDTPSNVKTNNFSRTKHQIMHYSEVVSSFCIRTGMSPRMNDLPKRKHR